jgi:hypothetical protein
MKTDDIAHIVSRETNGIGTDFIFDVTSRFPGYSTSPIPTRVLLDLLAPQGHIATTRHDLHLLPPESAILTLKDGSLSFLFEHSWVVCPTKCGKLQRMLLFLLMLIFIKDMVARYLALLSVGTVRPLSTKVFNVTKIGEAARTLENSALYDCVLIEM